MKLFNKYSLVLLLCSLLVSTGAFANVGSIIYGYGDYHALDRDGNKRKLLKGAKIFEGDTLVTGKRGRLHVRFSDGGMVSVYPGSEYKIDEYNFVAGDDTKQKGFFSLLRGGARQITGLLGKIKRDNFRFRTTVATIGIRGTGFFVKLCQADCFDADGNLLPDGMYVKNDTGIITMKTKGGDISLAQGQSAFAASNEDAPQQINEPVAPYNVAINDVETYDFDVGDAAGGGITDSGTIIDPPPPLVPFVINRLDAVVIVDLGSGVLGSSEYVADTVNPADSITNDATSISAFAGDLVDVSPISSTFDSTGGTLAESGNDQTLRVIWSRWSGGYSLVEGGIGVLTAGDVHAIGAEQLTQVLPLAGTSITYNGAGGTSPTFNGSAGSLVGTQSMTMTLDFVSGFANVSNLGLDLTFNGVDVISVQPQSVEAIAGNSGVINVFAICP
ncbi:MAG: FecR family protein, partial [Gammaproteobacteria bacterium]